MKSGGGGGPSVLKQPIKQVRRARRLRKQMSLPEVLLWKELQKRPGGHKFRKQFPQHPYTLDFACLNSRLAIEVDGESHNRGDQPKKDERRDIILEQRGFETIRFPASDILSDLENVVKTITRKCDMRGPPPPSRRDGPPPRSGEDL